jgi:hypothetical protein
MSNAQLVFQPPIYGLVTATAGTPVAVALPSIVATNIVLLSVNNGGAAGAAAGSARVVSVTAGTGFSINSVAGDTSVYRFLVL